MVTMYMIHTKMVQAIAQVQLITYNQKNVFQVLVWHDNTETSKLLWLKMPEKEESCPFSYLPERLEELHKFNEAHCAVRYHEVLEAFETAFTSTVPWPAAPCPTAHKEKSEYLNVSDKGAFKASDFGTSGLPIQY